MKHRLELISDGVFAIAMTLLVLELKVPEIPKAAPGEEIWEALAHLAPLFIAYLSAFTLSSVFWLIHTNLFKPLPQELDFPFFGLNTLMLFSVSTLPFTLSLWEKWHLRQETMQLFLLHYSLIAAAIGAQAIYIRVRGWWPDGHPSEFLVRISYMLPAAAIGGILAAILTSYSVAAGASPIFICALIGRMLSRRQIAR